MHIQLLSDLHLEANPHFVAEPAPGADLLVLAGDIGSYQRRPDGRVMPEPDWGLRRFSPLPQHAGWPVPVVFVPGNHEYDAIDVEAAHQALRSACDRLGIAWLEREQLVVQGVRLLGTTLWADYDALVRPEDPPAAVLRQREKAFRAANFYLRKMDSRWRGRLFDAQAMRDWGLACQDWLRTALSSGFAGPTVVITHFAPTLHSADPRYGLVPGTAGFCNTLDDLLTQADLWLHGHLHCPVDVQVGRCRIVANPLGYAEKDEQHGFVAQRVVQVAGLSTPPDAPEDLNRA
ncbi:MAG TPA: metallophosphoesterase [Hydrogenophaga sp.]|uniref:metallophosphoesterase n=1 Tax=Hydrogenophaga sp. TaxID=1904254 RepID=UPI002B93551B|nr:metallophosphoesterase [Hydrogenophaga sp.]HMN92682.1 metallophosphoesterase [Hydrogenophaga sp.]HMP09265.1 metallophosphoesterase [Hydrogenophaga sp.]